MGFYHPATLVKDAERHGVRMLPIDVTRSAWRCTIEGGAVRIGMRYVAGLRAESGRRIETERAVASFASVGDLVMRCRLRQDERLQLARAGACAALGGSRRDILWQVAALERDPDSLLARARGASTSPLPPMSALEETLADYASTGLTTGPHVMAHVRERLRVLGVITSAELRTLPHGHRVRVAGHVIVRQRPGTAKGMLFLTFEDETGTCNVVMTPPVFQRHRRLFHTCRLLLAEGPVQKVDDVMHVKGERFRELPLPGTAPPSHDFY